MIPPCPGDQVTGPDVLGMGAVFIQSSEQIVKRYVKYYGTDKIPMK